MGQGRELTADASLNRQVLAGALEVDVGADKEVSYSTPVNVLLASLWPMRTHLHSLFEPGLGF